MACPCRSMASTKTFSRWQVTVVVGATEATVTAVEGGLFVRSCTLTLAPTSSNNVTRVRLPVFQSRTAINKGVSPAALRAFGSALASWVYFEHRHVKWQASFSTCLYHPRHNRSTDATRHLLVHWMRPRAVP
eukprot:scaffold42613_cov305-Amphora_coffeaeformis.AAC.1